eukprot:997787-Pleurochrysis_carterae.AAC.1
MPRISCECIIAAIVALVAVEAAFASADRIRRSQRINSACRRARDGLQDEGHHLAVSGFNQFRGNDIPLSFIRGEGKKAGA